MSPKKTRRRARAPSRHQQLGAGAPAAEPDAGREEARRTRREEARRYRDSIRRKAIRRRYLRNAAYGLVRLVQPEELLVERILVSVYPQAYSPARDCAKKLVAVALAGIFHSRIEQSNSGVPRRQAVDEDSTECRWPAPERSDGYNWSRICGCCCCEAR